MKKKPTIILLAALLVITVFLSACQSEADYNPESQTGTSSTGAANKPNSETAAVPSSENTVSGAAVSGSSAPSSEASETSEPVSQKSSGILGYFQATDLNNNKVDQSVLKGKKLTMVNIWATFCGPCIREMPDLAKINKEYADKGFQIIGIPVDVTDRYGKISSEMVATAKEIVEKTGANYLHILPSASLNKAKLNEVSSLPETIFVDEYGNQVGESYVGSRSKEKWEQIINALLEQVS